MKTKSNRGRDIADTETIEIEAYAFKDRVREIMHEAASVINAFTAERDAARELAALTPFQQSLRYLERVAPFGPEVYVGIHYKAKLAKPGTWHGKRQTHRWLSRIARNTEEAMCVLRELAGQTGEYRPEDIYICQAALVEHEEKATSKGKFFVSNRDRSNAAWLRSLFFDIDVKGKGYATQQEALAALNAFCEAVGLPYATVIVFQAPGASTPI